VYLKSVFVRTEGQRERERERESKYFVEKKGHLSFDWESLEGRMIEVITYDLSLHSSFSISNFYQSFSLLSLPLSLSNIIAFF